MRFLDAALNPFHDEPEEVLSWYGQPFDLDDIDERYVRMALTTIADRRRGAPIGIDYGPDMEAEADIPRHRQTVTAVEPSQPLEDQEMRLHTDTMEAKSPPRPTARSGPEDSLSLEFLGCRPITLKLEDLDTHERRFEYWDRDTETAWEIREPTGAGHEIASQRLAALCYGIACGRGSPILCCGATDLDLRDEHGERYRIMQADQTVYLHPGRARLPRDAIVLGEHDFPDVVLEVDHTTDVRRGKLRLYEAWGFPELWVEVPDRYARSRPRGLFPGLRIYLLEEGSYRTTQESRALAGWTADEIHQALNEDEESEATSRAFRRVGRILGEREGTGPGDTPWLRMERQESRAEGRVKLMEAAMEAIPASRGMAPFRLDERDVRDVTDREVMDALLQCEGESDFRARLERLRREHP